MARASTTWQATFTRAEKEACIRAAIVDQLTYGEIARRAKAGELEGAGKFPITANYVGKLTREARATYRPERLTEPGAAETEINEARARGLAWILRAFEKWERNARAGKIDYAEHARLMRALAEHEKTTKHGKRSNGDDADTGQEQGPDPMSTIAALLEAASKQHTNGHNDNGTEPASAAHTG